MLWMVVESTYIRIVDKEAPDLFMIYPESNVLKSRLDLDAECEDPRSAQILEDQGLRISHFCNVLI